MTSSTDTLPQPTGSVASSRKPLLSLPVDISDFSIDTRILPGKEVPYLSVADLIRDENFNAKLFDSSVELHISIENRFDSLVKLHHSIQQFLQQNQEVDSPSTEASESICAVSTMGAIHNALIYHPDLMLVFQDKPLVIQDSPSKDDCAFGVYPCLRFDGETGRYYWDYCQKELDSGSVYFAKINRIIVPPNN